MKTQPWQLRISYFVTVKTKTVVITTTGHRPDKLGKEYDHKGQYSDAIREAFRSFLKAALGKGQVEVITGMALGVDTIFAEVAIELGIKITAAIPFIGQERMWPKKSQEHYHEILSNPLVTKVIVSEGGYAAWKLQRRNEWMINHCTHLIVIWNGDESGGTYNCLKYAKGNLKEENIRLVRLNELLK